MVAYPTIVNGKLVMGKYAEVYDGPFHDTPKGWGLARLFLEHTGLWDNTPMDATDRTVANTHAENYPKEFIVWCVKIRLEHGDDVLSHTRLGD